MHALERADTPVLPFELEVMQLSFNGLAKEQSRLGTLLGQAMEESSETWHDNAPADILNADSRILSERARRVTEAMRGTVGFDYPTMDERAVTLGSIVTYCFTDDPGEIERVYIAGLTRELPADILEQIDTSTSEDNELSVVTLASPLGRALLGKTIDEIAHYSVNGQREVSVLLGNVEQFVPSFPE
jgi:transcription elongation GreA/GreB family factor